jgi:dolichol-phosphate mannosyltransferase
MNPLISIVMPVYNEQDCIEETVLEWSALAAQLGSAKLIVVDDGSNDSTPRILNNLAGQCPSMLLIFQENGGHGCAILRGYREAVALGSEWVFQTDSDGQIPSAEFFELWPARLQSPFVLGWRKKRRDTAMRRRLSRAHSVLLRLLLGVSLPDPNIPFRLMQGALLSRYLQDLPPGSSFPNVHLAVLAARDNALGPQIPVAHHPRRGGATSIRGWKTAGCAVRSVKEYLWLRARLGKAASTVGR